jgi:hypothetical protein
MGLIVSWKSRLEKSVGKIGSVPLKLVGMMVARDGVEPPTPAFSGLASADLSPLAFNNLTLQSGPTFVTAL